MRDKTFDQIFIPYTDDKGKVTWSAISQTSVDEMRNTNPDLYWVEYENQPEKLLGYNETLKFDKYQTVDNPKNIPLDKITAGIDVGQKYCHYVIQSEGVILAREKVANPISAEITLRKIIQLLYRKYPNIKIAIDTGWQASQLYALSKEYMIYCCKGMGFNENSKSIADYNITGNTTYLDPLGRFYVSRGYEGTPLYINDVNKLKFDFIDQASRGEILFAVHDNEILSHLRSEVGTYKQGKYKKYVFTLLPNKESHYLDATLLALIARFYTLQKRGTLK